MRKLASVAAGISAIAMTIVAPSAIPIADAAPPAPNTSNLAWDDAAAVARNGPPIDADEVRICGANDRRFLGELLGGDPLNPKIPYRLGDVVAGNAKPSATLGRQMLISGTVESDVFGTGDFPFDHPGASDFNMDVNLDAQYDYLSQVGGVDSSNPMHTELAEFAVPHLPAAPSGPPTGMTWEENSEMSRQEIQPGYLPTKGDRVLVQGRWVNDCGHPPFSTELHPISFLAWSHTDVDKTVAQTYYAPYREMQLYNPNKALANKVNLANRDKLFYSVGFPNGLVSTILRIQNLSSLPEIDHFESWGMLEAMNVSPPDWYVCAPAGTSGDTLDVDFDVRARPGVVFTATPDPASGCAVMHADVSGNTAPEPTMRECVLPWDWLSKVAADEAGVPALDLKAEIKGFVAPQYQSRVDPDPIMDCYDPLKGAPTNPNPDGQTLTVDPTIAQPFYGRVTVKWATTPATTTTSEASTSSSSSTSSSTTTTTGESTTTTTATGQTVTVSPNSAAQGGAIEVNSGGWMPATPVTFTLDDGTVLGTITTDRFGTATGSFTLPSSTTVGVHELIARGTSVTGQAEVRVTVTVTQAVVFTQQPTTTTTGTLPVTGASIAGSVAVACFLILLGMGLVALVRRRPATGTALASD